MFSAFFLRYDRQFLLPVRYYSQKGTGKRLFRRIRERSGQVLPDKGNRVEHDAVKNRDGRGDGGAEFHIFHIIRGGILLVNAGSPLETLGGDFHGGNVPVIGGTRRDKGGRPGIFFQVGEKIRIVFIVLGGDVHQGAGQVEAKFHKRYFWGVWVVDGGGQRRPPLRGGIKKISDHGRRGTWAPPYRPSQSPSVTALPEGEPRGMDGRKRGDGMPSPRLGFLLSLGFQPTGIFPGLVFQPLGFLLSLGFAQPMMLPYWSTTTLVPSGRVIA